MRYEGADCPTIIVSGTAAVPSWHQQETRYACWIIVWMFILQKGEKLR
jgi:hypothetical protein